MSAAAQLGYRGGLACPKLPTVGYYANGRYICKIIVQVVGFVRVAGISANETEGAENNLKLGIAFQ